ncbi:hypothetical protein OH77DRAFT_1590992 [Trametes cingulata]|nr:hypothetical protein OH77DRAFT_1590992 [Trametes cingulata]
MSPNAHPPLANSGDPSNQPAPKFPLESDDVNQLIFNDITDLKKRVKIILDLFKKVHSAFALFDHQYKLGTGKEGTEPLAPQWKQYWNRFVQYLEDSRKDANTAAAIMETYSGALLMDLSSGVAFDAASLLREIERFKASVEKNITVANQVKNNFLGLADDIHDFEIRVEITLSDLDMPLPEEVVKGRNRLTNLRKYLKSVFEEITHADASLVLGLGGFILHTATALCSLVPSLGPKTLWSVRGFSCITREKEVNDASAEWKRHGKQFTASLDASGVPKGVQTFYKDWWVETQADVVAVCDRIKAIGNIWDTLSMDLNQLQVQLTLCGDAQPEGTQVITSPFLKSKIELSRIVFEHLIRCLKMYARQL